MHKNTIYGAAFVAARRGAIAPTRRRAMFVPKIKKCMPQQTYPRIDGIWTEQLSRK